MRNKVSDFCCTVLTELLQTQIFRGTKPRNETQNMFRGCGRTCHSNEMNSVTMIQTVCAVNFITPNKLC